MKKVVVCMSFVTVLSIHSLAIAVETAPRITDREIIERLVRLEEGQNALRTEVIQLRKDTNTEITQLREDMNTEITQLREDMNTQFNRIDAQFDRMFQLMLGLVGAFAAIVATTIGFAVWDRRTMVRPFETKIKKIEEEISHDRQKFHSLLEALRALSRTDEKVAEVLKKFNLL